MQHLPRNRLIAVRREKVTNLQVLQLHIELTTLIFAIQGIDDIVLRTVLFFVVFRIY